jgi:hypothetical protein
VEEAVEVQASIEQVAGILVREGLLFQLAREERRHYRLRYGSAAVFIQFHRWGRRSVVITVSSPVLQDVDEESAGAARALNLINSLNSTHYYLRFTFDEGMLLAEYDLLGDELQADELLNAVHTVGSVADHLDDELHDLVGGKRFADKLEEWAVDGDDT